MYLAIYHVHNSGYGIHICDTAYLLHYELLLRVILVVYKVIGCKLTALLENVDFCSTSVVVRRQFSLHILVTSKIKKKVSDLNLILVSGKYQTQLETFYVF